MKKLFVIMLAMMMVLVAGCSGNSDTQPSEIDVIVFKVAHTLTEDTTGHKALVEFEAFVEKETAGAVDVQLFPNGELGGDRQALDGVSLGNIQMSTMNASVLSGYDERFSVLDLPFLFKSQKKMEAAINGELGALFNSWMEEAGFMGLGFQYEGARSVSNNVRPIYTTDDLNGVKIRVMETPMYISLFNALGANPTPMSFNELYSGLQQGVVDGQDNSPIVTYTTALHEVLDYYSLTKHTYSNAVIVTNKDYMDKLPEDVRNTILKGAQTYLVDKQRKEETALEGEYLDKMKEEGVQINEITPENLLLFTEKASVVYDEFRDKLGNEVIDKVIELAN